MPTQLPPSNDLFARAAELRVAGRTWKTVAAEVRRTEQTVRKWPRKYPDRWLAALLQAERFMTAQADNESIHTLRGLLVSKDEKVRWHAANALIARRVARDKMELKSRQETDQPLSNEAYHLLVLMDRHTNEELKEIIGSIRPLPVSASGGGEPQP
jgi:hypothetical protein